MNAVEHTFKAAVFAFLLGYLLVGPGCGVPKPPPVVPAGEVSCEEACTHVEHDLPLCGTSKFVCETQLCDPNAVNDPTFPTCLRRAESCEAITACDNP